MGRNDVVDRLFRRGQPRHRALAATGAGLVGGSAMGALFYGPGDGAPFALFTTVYGTPGVTVVGYAAHLLHAVTLALAFAAIVSSRPVARRLSTAIERLPSPGGRWVIVAGLGLVYGVGLWLVGWGYVLPWLLSARGLAPIDPWGGWLDGPTLVAHLVYALVTAATMLALVDRLTDE